MRKAQKGDFSCYLPLMGVGGAYAVFSFVLALAFGAPWEELLHIGFVIPVMLIKYILFLILSGIVVFCRILLTPPRGMRKKWKRWGDFFNGYLNGEVFVHACMGILVMVELCFFFIFKSLIPKLQAYSWDPALAVWDKAFHFGRYPHEWITPLVEKFSVGVWLDHSYFYWFPVMMGVLGYGLFCDRNLHRRLRFLWTFLLLWIVVGSVMATALSSVGPLFYARFYPDMPDIYAGLVTYLEAHKDDLIVMSATRYLLLYWTDNGNVVNLNALSAMPSMHVGVVWLFVLYARTVNPVFFAAISVFFVTILTASVYLGFHYAIDGYVAMIAVSLLWWGSGRWLDRRYPDLKGKILELTK